MKSPGLVFLLLLHRSYSVLEVVAPGTHNALIGSNTLVPCTFTVDKPPINTQFLAILWQYGEKELIRYDNKEKYVTPRMSIDEDEARQGNASLIIHNVTIADQGTYKCLIIYSPNRGVQEVHVNIQAIPKVTLVKKALSKNRKNRLLCLISNIFPKDIMVTWLRNGQTLDGSEIGIFEMNVDGTYRVNSTLTISSEESQNHPVITCQVDHVSHLDPIQDAFTVEYGVEPTISLFSSHDGNKEIFMCEVKKFYPEAVEIKWLIDGQRSEPSRRNADGTYNKWNHFLISGSQKRSTNISCVVEHETLDDPLMESIILKVKKDSQTPALIAALSLLALLLTVGILAALWLYKRKYFEWFQVSPIHIPVGWSSNTDKTLTMYCSASNCQAEIQVSWTVIENDGKELNITEHQRAGERDPLTSDYYKVGTHQSKTDELYNAITSLTFTPTVLNHRKMKVVCSFLSSGKTKRKVKEWSFIVSKPLLLTPLKMSLDDIGDVVCCVTLEKFYPKNIQITWSSGVGNYQELNTTRENFKDNSDGTFSCESECRVPGQLFQDPGFRVRVTWAHPSISQPETQKVTATDLPWCPVMGDIKMPPLLHNREAKLQCVISGYFPSNLEVKWLWREADKMELYDVLSNDKYKIPMVDIQQEFDKTYTSTSALIVSMSAITDQGVEFICRVRHPSLKSHLEKRTGKLTVKGKPVVRKILQSGVYVIMEIDSFYTQNLVVTWEKSDKRSGKYKQYEDKCIQSKRRENSDGSFSLISICEAMGRIDLVNPMDTYVKATITHEALESAYDIYFIRTKGYFYNLSETGKKMLDQADQDTFSKLISEFNLKVSGAKNSGES